MNICPDCGAEIIEGTTRCIRCGKYLESHRKTGKGEPRGMKSWPKALLLVLVLVLAPALAISLPIALAGRSERSPGHTDYKRQSFLDSVELAVQTFLNAGDGVDADYLTLVLPPEKSDQVYDSGESWALAFDSGESLKNSYLEAAGKASAISAPDGGAAEISGLLQEYCDARAAEIDDVLDFSLSVLGAPPDVRAARLEQRITEMGGSGYSFENSNLLKERFLKALETYVYEHDLDPNPALRSYLEESR